MTKERRDIGRRRARRTGRAARGPRRFRGSRIESRWTARWGRYSDAGPVRLSDLPGRARLRPRPPAARREIRPPGYCTRFIWSVDQGSRDRGARHGAPLHKRTARIRIHGQVFREDPGFSPPGRGLPEAGRLDHSPPPAADAGLANGWAPGGTRPARERIFLRRPPRRARIPPVGASHAGPSHECGAAGGSPPDGAHGPYTDCLLCRFRQPCGRRASMAWHRSHRIFGKILDGQMQKPIPLVILEVVPPSPPTPIRGPE